MAAHLDWHPPRYDLVRHHSRDDVNRELDRRTLVQLGEVGHEPHALRQRLWALDREWDIDRALFAVYALLGGVSSHRAVRAARRGRRWSAWRVVFWAQLGWLMHHAIRGWSPPIALLRRLGFRSDKEIAAERVALEKRLAGSTGV